MRIDTAILAGVLMPDDAVLRPGRAMLAKIRRLAMSNQPTSAATTKPRYPTAKQLPLTTLDTRALVFATRHATRHEV